MSLMNKPAQYDLWYQSPQGAWIGHLETQLLSQLMPPSPGASLLDIGCGSGYFTRFYADHGMQVSGIDPDPKMIAFAAEKSPDIHYLLGNALDLPYADKQFDYCSAITSLCFIQPPQQALNEMWRVSNKGMVLGLLNRNSFLYAQKAGRGNYKDVRWDSQDNVRDWVAQLQPQPAKVRFKSTLFIPGMGMVSQVLEPLFAKKLLFGGFLAVYLSH